MATNAIQVQYKHKKSTATYIINTLTVLKVLFVSSQDFPLSCLPVGMYVGRLQGRVGGHSSYSTLVVLVSAHHDKSICPPVGAPAEMIEKW